MGTDFAFCLALNEGGQKKTVSIIFSPSGMPFKRTESTFFRVLIFEKTAITTFFLAFFDLPETL